MDTWTLDTVLFSLDALDRALTRTKGSAVTSLTYQALGETLAKTVNGSSTTTYVSTGEGALAEKTGSTAKFYLRDPHGDSSFLLRPFSQSCQVSRETRTGPRGSLMMPRSGLKNWAGEGSG